MSESPKPIPLAFWRSTTDREPVREWLKELSREDKTDYRARHRENAIRLANRIAVVPTVERRLVGGPLVSSNEARG